MKGKIHSIETMGSVDGPGLRYIIFLQGCGMKCIYCHNRDTWALTGGTEVDSDDVLLQLESLKAFYHKNNGGITITGGEPLLQAEFVYSVFSKVKDIGLTTALDTAGNVKLTDNVKYAIGKTDYLLLDIKSLDDDLHRKITGVNKNLVTLFIDYVKKNKINTWLRYVYLPGYTDSETDLIKLAEFINNFPSITRVDILPYHTMGKEKWENLGLIYPLEGLGEPEKHKVEDFREKLRCKTSVVVK